MFHRHTIRLRNYDYTQSGLYFVTICTQDRECLFGHIVGAGILPPQTIKKIFQRNYYEHIIRNENELFAIREYIEDNPSMWYRDRNKNPIDIPPNFL